MACTGRPNSRVTSCAAERLPAWPRSWRSSAISTPQGSPPATQQDYAANVPRPLKDAILLTVQLLYDPLSDGDRQAIERTREALVQPYRIQLAL